MCLFPGLFCPDFSFSATLKDIVNIDTSLMRAPSQKIRILLINSLKRNWWKREVLLGSDLVYLRSFPSSGAGEALEQKLSVLLPPTPSFARWGVSHENAAALGQGERPSPFAPWSSLAVPVCAGAPRDAQGSDKHLLPRSGFQPGLRFCLALCARFWRSLFQVPALKEEFADRLKPF